MSTSAGVADGAWLRISGTTSRLDYSRQLRRCVAQRPHRWRRETWWWNEHVEKAIAAKQKAFKAWKAGKGTRASYDAAKQNARHAVHHPRQEADKKVYENIDPRSSEVYRLANKFRRENTDVVGDKPVKNDAGEMSMSEDSKQKAWLEHYQRLLNVEFDWDPDHLSYQPPVECLPIPITTHTVKKAISQMNAGKAQGPSGIVVEMILAIMIRDLAAAIIRDGKVPSDWEQSFIVCPYKGGHIGKGQLLWSIADRAGYENPGEDCGWPHQTVGVNRRFPVWLRPRQRHYRRNLCCQAAAIEVSSCQQETLHGFRRPGEGVWSSTLEGQLVGAEKTWCGGVDCATGAWDVWKCAEPCPCSWGVQWRVWSEGWCSPRISTQPTALHHCAWSLIMRVPLWGSLGRPLCWWPCYHCWIAWGMCQEALDMERSNGEERTESKCRKDKDHDLRYGTGPPAEGNQTTRV